jgi:nitrate/nitrite transporter NarK
MYAMFLMVCTGGLMTTGNMSQIAKSLNVFDAKFMGIAIVPFTATVAGVTNALARIMWGSVSDRFGREYTMAFAFAVPNGRTTQVFFNQRDNSSTHDAGRPADGQPFVPFGRILEGLDVAAALNSEYGEGPGGIRAGRQDPFFDGGNAWLLTQFPRLDYIRKAMIR